jgi:serine/threonine protein kinase
VEEASRQRIHKARELEIGDGASEVSQAPWNYWLGADLQVRRALRANPNTTCLVSGVDIKLTDNAPTWLIDLSDGPSLRCSDDSCLYLVMEYAKGGDLLDRILDKSRDRNLTELETKFFVWQILVALLYLHTQQIPVCHGQSIALRQHSLPAADSEENLVPLRALAPGFLCTADNFANFTGTYPNADCAP